MKHLKKMLALVMAICLVLGLTPGSALAAEATETPVAAAIFCSDVHNSTSDVNKVFSGIETPGVNFSTATFVGDTFTNSSSINDSTQVTSVAQTALDDTNIKCLYAYGDHDSYSDIKDYTGMLYTGDNYYVYAISHEDMKTASAAESAVSDFNTTVASMDTSKPLFIASHAPLHERRNDNFGAAAWYEAISAAAEKIDIVFFWAHNHTSESDVDTAAYYVAKDGSETITIEGGSAVVPNFTYMNAGYINANNQSPKRIGVATTVAIYDDSMVFQDYNSSGEYSGSYAHNVTVTREFASKNETINTVSADTTYLDDDDSYVENGNVITATGLGLTAVSAVYNDELDLSTIYGETDEGYSVYDVEMSGYAGGDADISFDVYGVDLTGAVVYLVNSDNTTTKLTGTVTIGTAEEDVTCSTVSFTVPESAIVDGSFTVSFGVQEIVIPEGYILSDLAITGDPLVTKYFVDKDFALDSSEGSIPLDITGLEVTATYTSGTDSINKVLLWNAFDADADAYALNFDMAQIGTQDVEISYTYEGVQKTTSYEITICHEEYTDTTTDVNVVFETPEVTDVVITKNDADESVASSLEYLLENYVSYDFELEGYTEGNEVTVTLPVPTDVEKVGVFHVSDAGKATRVKDITENTDGTVTFVATAFSKYVVGEDVEIEVPDPVTATGSKTTTTTTTKTVYVLTSSISSGNKYLIANRASAGSVNLVANDDGDLSYTASTVIYGDADGDGDSEYYIELTDATNELWTVAGSYTFENQDEYLRCNNGNLSVSSQSTTWSYSSNRLSYKGGNKTYYLRYNNGWTVSDKSNNASSIYFYVPTEIEVETTTTVSGTYSIAGNPAEISKVVVEGTTTTLGSTLTFVPESGTTTTTDTTTTATYTVVENGDSNGVISGISGNTVTFTGNYGKALVKVSYTVTINGKDYTVDNYIKVTATEPTYSIEITETEKDADGNRSAGEIITDTIAIKGETTIAAGYDLWAKVEYEDADGKEEIVVDAGKLTWSSSNTLIATVDGNGIVTFTGNEGTVQITVYYAYEDGKQVTDTITFSVSKSQYVIPSDGTDDFPEYPNQGAIRFDKTATAVGNFSETGIAQVELSMTGVPYGTSTKTDVVVMVDMTSSMEENDITAAKLAVQELIETLVYDEENNVYDENIQLFVSSFSSGTSTDNIVITDHLDNVTISSADDLTAAKNKITDSTDGFRDDRHSTNGTHYGVALADVYATLNREGAAENQYVIFVTDGVPTRYYYLNSSGSYTEVTGSNSDTESLAAGWFDDDGEVTSSFQTEYYTYLIKGMGVPVYTIGANLSAGSDASDLINHMSSNYSADGKTSTGETKYSFTCTTSDGITDEVLAIFQGIGQDIKEAATNVVVEDKIADEYTMNFSLPSGVTAAEAGMEEFYIQVVGYELDENNERKANPEVLEKFLFNSDGTITHTIGSTTCDDTCTHVTYTDGVVTAIDGTYFDYSSTEENGEILTWTADKLDRTELALQYFVYLDNSAGTAVADQVDAGTYNTNEYATITYTNFKGNECQQEFPVPSLTWKGAQVTYVFYLVNEAGKPVNRAGKVVPFAEAVYVTNPVTYDVTWNEEAGSENMLAHNLFAIANVPDVYELYDENAYYEIRVYQTEGVDEDTSAVNYNYFTISGADSGLTSKETTKVFNTKAGTKYDDYGVYSAEDVGTVLNTTDTDGNATTVTTTVKTTDIDYANTTVAFAVVWKPALVEDTVVIDYGLDVVIDVYTNDGLAAGVTGVSLNAPTDVEINKGTYPDGKKVGSDSITSADGVWTAVKESLTSVRFHLNNMLMNQPATFYYEAGVNYYTYDSSNNPTLNTTNMYSSVTVIPATTIYYEDTFVTYTDSTACTSVEDAAYGAWSVEGTKNTSATQDTDRPGESKISEDLDADNVYGYDSAYTECTTYSLGSAHKVTVSTAQASDWPKATFTFTGTGFDVISQTSNMTGTITVNVVNTDGTYNKTWFVDTYYGYKYTVDSENPYLKYIFTYCDDGKWHTPGGEAVAAMTLEDGETTEIPANPEVGDKVVVFEDNGTWEATTNTDNTLYQIPVIKSPELAYDTYTVTITPRYANAFNHVGDDSYDFYLDAIRIYNPAQSSVEANSAYVKDNEAYPAIVEIRNYLLDQKAFDTTSDNVTGAVFIDGYGISGDISDYTAYGPNNEVYLTAGQAIAFKVTDANGANMAAAHIGVKAPQGGDASILVEELDATTYETIDSVNISTSSATELYYDISECVDLSSGMSKVIVISNNSTESGAMVSLTNLKVTHKSEASETGIALAMSYDDSVAVASVMSARFLASIPMEEVFEPEIFTVDVNKTTAVVGDTVRVTVQTSSDVALVTVNGNNATMGRTNNRTGLVSWTYSLKATEAGALDIEAVAYDTDGIASEAILTNVEVVEAETVVKEIETVVYEIVNQIKNWFTGLFRR